MENEARGNLKVKAFTYKNVEGDKDALYSPLSSRNYKEKFDRLVKAEKESHEGILRERYILC